MKCKHTSTVTLFTHTALKKPNPHPATRQCKLTPQTTPSTPRRRDTEVGRARGKPHRLCSMFKSQLLVFKFVFRSCAQVSPQI